MEEEEVLSLFDFVEQDISYFALMKYNSDSYNTEIQEYFNDVIKEYYKSRNIKFLWYGDNYNDIEDSIEWIISEIDRESSNQKSGLQAEDVRDILLGKVD